LVFTCLASPVGATIDEFFFDAYNHEGDGTGYTENFYLYENAGYWTQWFYDGEYNPDRYKTVDIELALSGPEHGKFDMDLWWSTPEWSVLGNPGPPLPPLTPENEDLYIEKVHIDDFSNPNGYYDFYYEIDGYNPEWVAISLSGYDYFAGGIIDHMCVSSVPIPGAVWLLGSGLIGLIGARKKFRK
jgi:hypothetical protein